MKGRRGKCGRGVGERVVSVTVGVEVEGGEVGGKKEEGVKVGKEALERLREERSE